MGSLRKSKVFTPFNGPTVDRRSLSETSERVCCEQTKVMLEVWFGARGVTGRREKGR